MYCNGFIIQENKITSYKGVDGSGFDGSAGQNWYLNYDEQYKKDLEPYYDEYIGKTYWELKPHTWVGACTDLNYIKNYIRISKEKGIDYRVLLVKTDISSPILDESIKMETEFLGYDYAYANGDNYSALHNEVPFVFPQFRLAPNGLLQTREEIREYICCRENYIKNHPPLTLEEGDFTVFELYEVNI